MCLPGGVAAGRRAPDSSDAVVLVVRGCLLVRVLVELRAGARGAGIRVVVRDGAVSRCAGWARTVAVLIGPGTAVAFDGTYRSTRRWLEIAELMVSWRGVRARYGA